MRVAAWIGVVMMAAASAAVGQTLRFDEYREQQIPDHANLRIGPFYSDIAFSQSAGYRYTTSSGNGRDYLYKNDYGRIMEDGSEFPLVSQLSFRNYVIISKYMDLDISFSLGYRYFPMGTEEDEFIFDVVGPAISATMGSFSFSMAEDTWLGSFNGRQASAYMGERGRGVAANVSSDFQLTPFVRGRIYDMPSYRTEYVDERGYTDNTSGREYTAFQNLLGLDMDWLMAKDKNLAYSASRVDTIPQGEGFDIQRSVVYNQGLAYQQQLNPVAAGGARANYVWRLYEEGRGDQFQQDYSVFLGTHLSEDTLLQTALGYSMGELTDANQWESNGTSTAVIGLIRLQSQLTANLSHALGYEKSQRGGFDAGFELVDSYSYSLAWKSHDWSMGFLTAYQVVEPRLSRTSDYSDWLNQFTAARALNDYMTLTLATVYTIRDNGSTRAGDIGEGDLMIENSYDTWASNIGLAYVLGRYWTLKAYVEHLERLSDAEDLAFTRDMAGIDLTFSRDL